MPFCDRCDRWFTSQDALWQHERMSSSHWICYDCDKDFPTEWGLIQHYVQSPRHHYCQRCDEHFDSDYELKEHYSDAHWYCRLCNKVRDASLPMTLAHRGGHSSSILLSA